MQLSDAELRGQVTVTHFSLRAIKCVYFCSYIGHPPTADVAFRKTTSAAVSWALWTLALHPSVQDRLRKEIWEASENLKMHGRDQPTSDE